MITRTGNNVEPLSLSVSDIRLDDFAAALSKICRYGGHTSRFYSVAEHSVLLAVALPNHLRRAALLHDVSEAYVGDMPSPLKARIPQFEEIERPIIEAVFKRYNVPIEELDAIKEADLRICSDEMDALLSCGAPEWFVEEHPHLGVRVDGIAPEAAEFIYRYWFRTFFGEDRIYGR